MKFIAKRVHGVDIDILVQDGNAETWQDYRLLLDSEEITMTEFKALPKVCTITQARPLPNLDSPLNTILHSTYSWGSMRR